MKKKLVGTVKSDKMVGTASVVVDRFRIHRKYKKRIRTSKSYLVDNAIKAKMGNIVEIEATRPLSKNKHFKIVKIIK